MFAGGAGVEIFGYNPVENPKHKFKTCSKNDNDDQHTFIHDILWTVLSPSRLTIQLARHRMAFTNHFNVTDTVQDDLLFSFETFYVALNGVVSGTSDRVGAGFCSLCVLWYDDWTDLPPIEQREFPIFLCFSTSMTVVYRVLGFYVISS